MFVRSVSLLGAVEPWTLRACCIIQMSNVTKVEDVGQLLVMVCDAEKMDLKYPAQGLGSGLC